MRMLRMQLVLVGLLVPATAHAHFVLQAPRSRTEQDGQGDPQKSSPCGQNDAQRVAVPTNVVTAFEPGQTITITIDEVTYHPGHYRVVLSPTGPSGLPADPETTPPRTCESLAIQEPPVYPVLADGMLPHTEPFAGPQSFQVVLPDDVACERCTLQVLEFMSAEVGGNGACFYHHCADISIAAAGSDAGSGCACGVGERGTAAGLWLSIVIGWRARRRRRV
jgi:hypothetical protein